VRRTQLVERVSAVLTFAVSALALVACGGGSSGSQSSATTPPSTATHPLQVLVTNDDGVSAPGINAVVQALRNMPGTQVTVVAPAANQSGTGNKTTSGALTVTNATTASGYPAKAVAGYPVDTIIWAVDQKGLPSRPGLVVSGVNNGENVGPLTTISGTVGAARAAASRGIPALAASQGVDNNLPPDYQAGAQQVVAWVTKHRAALVAGTNTSPVLLENLNVPTCPGGAVRGPVQAPVATNLTGRDLGRVDCTSSAQNPPDDVAAFLEGFVVISPLAP
jgi:5'-nucleotidase